MTERRLKNVQFFKPRGTAMRRETRVIKMVLTGWLLAIFFSQVLVFMIVDPAKKMILNQFTFFNLPIPLWLTGQFMPLWFVILCVIFNLWMDSQTTRDPDGSMRFRVRAVREGEE